MRRVVAGALDVAFEELGDPSASPVILLHGFPYDVESYGEVAPRLAAAGRRVITPYLRGYGPTRFLSPDTLRSGQQAALAHDLLALMDALAIERATLAGYDWGGRAACIVAALWPERVRGLVSCDGYNLQNIPAAGAPAAPEDEHRFWYQYYFHGERGRMGLERNRRALCRLLWQLWSPDWQFDDATWERSAGSFDNPDFVEVVVHSYRHRYGLVAGDPAFQETEHRLESQPAIAVPTVVLDGASDGVALARDAANERARFTGSFERIALPRIGHNVPQEAPAAFANAVLSLP